MTSIVNDNQTTPMSETNIHSNSPPPRVLRIWMPKRKISWSMLIVLAVGIFISYLIAMAFVGLALALVSRLLNLSAQGFLMFVTIVLSIFGPYLWVRFYNQWQHRKRMMLSIHRSVRLANLFAENKAIDRLPHRYIEHIMRRSSTSTKAIKRAILTMCPGVVIVANEPKLDKHPRLTSNDILFEPIDLRDDKEQAESLITANYETQNHNDDVATAKEEEPAEGSPKHLYQQARQGIFQLLGIVYFILIGRSVILGNNPALRWIIITCLMFWVLVVLFSRILTEHRSWLVPGGMFYRQYRFWKKKLKVKLLRATDTPLFLNLELGQAMVIDDGKVRSISISPSMGLAILAGWISTAHTPTNQEIQSFVGITSGTHSEI